MKWLMALLVLANIGIYAYFNSEASKTLTASPEINPDKVQLLTTQALTAMPKRVEPVNPSALTRAAPSAADLAKMAASSTSCYKWTHLGPSNLPSAQVELVKLGLQGNTIQEGNAGQDKRFWVYYPPLKNVDLARKKADEIKKLGVDELFIVQDSQWRNAISFGLFNDEQLANNLLNSLYEKGVRRAVKGVHSGGMSTLLIKDVSPMVALELYKVKPEFIGTELAPSACS